MADGKYTLLVFCGVIVTIITIVLLFLYMVDNIVKMMKGATPTINIISTEGNFRTPDSAFDLREANFTVAFGVRDTLTD